MSTPRQIVGLAAWLLLCYAAAALGAAASIQARTFYLQLDRPSWAPPGWVFGPVWTVLYFLIALSAWLVWRERGFPGARVPLALFLAQLAANALWSWLFFAWRLGSPAFAEILLLWLLILATALAFRPIRPLAAILLIPYLLWVSFASALNFALWRANPHLLL